MVFREYTPDKAKDSHGIPITVLPQGHVLCNRYAVTYLTAGGMGLIYKARWDGKTFIIKEVDGKDGKDVIALNQEKATIERLSHPNIVKAFELFEEEGYYYLVLEYIDGENLFKKVPKSDTVFLSEKVVLDWARQLIDIFEYLHSQTPPIIYRDLKPQNILLDSTGTIKLIDFGIARVFKETKAEDTMKLGSVITASPEHYGDGQTDMRSDIYTLGATIHFLLTNNRSRSHDPFKYTRIREINPRVSERTDRAIAKALQMRPVDRFQTMAEMKEALLGTAIARGDETSELMSGSLSFHTVEMQEEQINRKAPHEDAAPATSHLTGDMSTRPVPQVSAPHPEAPEVSRKPNPGRHLIPLLIIAGLLVFTICGALAVKSILGIAGHSTAGRAQASPAAASASPAPSAPPASPAAASASPAPSAPPASPASSPASAQAAVPASAESQLASGREALEKGDLSAAEDAFKRILLSDPANAEALWSLGETYEAGNEQKKAFESYNRYIRSGSADAARLRHIALLYSAVKDYKRAVTILKKAQKINDSVEGYFAIGSCHSQAGEPGKAISALREGLKKDRNHVATLILLAVNYRKNGDYAQALGAYKAAHDLNPRQISLLDEMADTACEMGDYHRAKDYLKRYLNLENDSKRSYDAERRLEKVTRLAMRTIPPAVEKQTDFLTGVRVLGILKYGSAYKAFLEIGGIRHEIAEGDTVLSDYYVMSIREERIILTQNETYTVLRPQ